MRKLDGALLPEPSPSPSASEFFAPTLTAIASMTPHNAARDADYASWREGGGGSAGRSQRANEDRLYSTIGGDLLSSPQDRDRSPRSGSSLTSTADVLARHRQVTASLPPRKLSSVSQQDSPLAVSFPAETVLSPTLLEPISTLKSRRSMSPSPPHTPAGHRSSDSPPKSKMKAVSYSRDLGSRTPRLSSSQTKENWKSEHEGNRAVNGETQSISARKNHLASAPKMVSKNRLQPLQDQEQQGRQQDLGSLSKKFCVGCGNEMGVLYRFCQMCGKECVLLSPRIQASAEFSLTVEKESSNSLDNALLTPAVDFAANGNGQTPKYDLFISYRSASDMQHAKDMFRELSSREVEEGGRRRKIKVFLDRISLRTDHETRNMNAAEALCNSSIVLAIISRGTFFLSSPDTQNPTHDFSGLGVESVVDRVLWEWCLAVEISAMRGKHPTLVLPVLVGDFKADRMLDDECYTDFFTSECAPREVPDVHVRRLYKLLKTFLHKRFHCTGQPSDIVRKDPRHCVRCLNVRNRTVYEIVSEIFEFQPLMVSGLRESAWRDCYDAISATVRHICVQRDVECLRFSHPLGHEVLDWLQTHALSDLSSTFAKLQLDSLHKVSRLTTEQIFFVCAEAEDDEGGAKIVTGHSKTFPMGMHIVLGEAVESLRFDERAQTLSNRLSGYRDTGSLDFLNLILRQNQMSVIFSNVWLRCLIVLCLLLVGVLGGTFVFLDYARKPSNTSTKKNSSKAADNFNSVYLMVLFIPAAMNIVIQACFPKKLTADWTARINLLYSLVVSSTGLIIVHEEASSDYLDRHQSLRNNLMMRIQATILGLSFVLFVISVMFPQVFLLAASMSIVSAVGIQILLIDVAEKQPWHNGVIILSLGYLAVFVLLLLNTLYAQHVKKVLLENDGSEYLKIWAKAMGFAEGAPGMPQKTALASIHKLCREMKRELANTRRMCLAFYPWWQQLLFWIGCGACGRYGRTGKRRQETSNIDALFHEAMLISPVFFHELDSVLERAATQDGMRSSGFSGDRSSFLLRQAPIKRPFRALEKIVRKYYADPCCLTDLVRCTVLLDSISEIQICLDAILSNSRTSIPQETNQDALESMIEEESVKTFVLTSIKDNLHSQADSQRQSICLNLEVAWDGAAGSSHIQLLPVNEWNQHPHSVRRHICEVEIMLCTTYEHSVYCQESRVRFRNLLYR